MVGTLQLARALTDRDLSDQLLAHGMETALRLLNDQGMTASQRTPRQAATTAHVRAGASDLD
jgi:hypothetical protein